MKIPTPKLSDKTITILVTLGIIGIGYIFYFYVYVENNEKDFQDRAFRTLEQIGENIKEKNKGNQYNTNTIIQNVKHFDFTKDSSQYDKNVSDLSQLIKNLRSSIQENIGIRNQKALNT